jgi:hypothetical protein
MRRTLCYQVGIPVWFLFVGALGTVYPPPTPVAAIVAFAIALVIVPVMTLAADAYCMRRAERSGTASPVSVAALRPR